MTITVVVPTFNEEHYLPHTLDSLKKLDRKPDEVIVIDGGSTDKTTSIAKKWGAKVLVEPRRGIGLARDLGLKKATSDIVAYTDADTIVPTNWLSEIQKTLSLPKVVCVFGSFRVPHGWWFYKYYVNYFQPVANLLYYWIGVPMAPGQNMAFWRQKALAVGGFPENFVFAEDIEMATRLKAKGKLVMRQDLIVLSSGRRGNEGVRMMRRVFKAFFLYFFFKKANTVGFPDIREAESLELKN